MTQTKSTHRDIYTDESRRPKMLPPVDNLPAILPSEMRERQQWVLWRLIWKHGRWAKIPHTLADRWASTSDPKTWGAFDDIWKSYRSCRAGCGMEGGYEGVGFVFSDADPFTGVDLDCSLAMGKILTPWARPILERFEPAYCEISPSGTGLKLWCRGQWKGEGNKYPYQGGEVEVYSTGRFFCVTGRTFTLDGGSHDRN